MFKARECSSKGAKWDKAKYSTLDRAGSETAECALRDRIAAGQVSTLTAAVDELRCIKAEIIAAVNGLPKS